MADEEFSSYNPKTILDLFGTTTSPSIEGKQAMPSQVSQPAPAMSTNQRLASPGRVAAWRRFRSFQAFCQLRLLDSGQRQAVDAALDIGSRALTNVSALRSDRLAMVVRDLEADTAPYGHIPAVVDLRDQIMSLR
jgi:hypothetical protein